MRSVRESEELSIANDAFGSQIFPCNCTSAHDVRKKSTWGLTDELWARKEEEVEDKAKVR
jgi:hypothetical protein